MSGESTTAVHRSQVDLLDFVDWSGVECLNQNSSHSVANALKQGYREDEGLHLESAADEQLLLYIPFTQVIELHSLLIRGPDEEGPRTVKLFANKEHMGFSNVNDYPPSDSLVLFSEHLKGKPAVLKFVKFQNVRSLTIFIEDNQSGADITKVQKISLYGTTLYINKHKRSKRKSVDSSEISACLWSLCEVMHARNAIALRHVNLLSDPIHAERERARTETEEYKRSLNLMRRLPGYDVKKEMYTSGLSLFLNDHNRRMWLTLEDDVDYAEKWLKGLWEEKNSSG